MSLQNIINYVNGANFTYDSSIVDFTGTAVELTNIRPANATFYAGFHGTFDADYGDGSLTATLSGTPVLGTYYASLVGSGNFLSFSAPLNTSFTQVGTIRLDVTPLYSGAPGNNQNIISINSAPGSLIDLLEFRHDTGTSIFHYFVYDSAGSVIVNGSFSWVPVSGTSYELEMDFDVTTGATRMFIDGIQQGATQTGTGTRGNSVTEFDIGNDYTGGATVPNFRVTNIILFDTVQHTANFPSEIPRAPETTYSLTNPTVAVIAQIAMSELNSFIETAVKPANTDIKYQLLVNGLSKYWNGAAWATSDGSYAQSNTAAIINTNATSLLPPGANIRVVALLSSTYGNATPTLTSVEEDYEFFVAPPTSPSLCILYCFLEDIIGFTNLTNATLICQVPNSFVINNWVVGISQVNTAFNSSGYVQVPLVATDSVGVKYGFSITYTDEAGIDRQIFFNDAVIPTQTSINITDLTTIQAGS